MYSVSKYCSLCKKKTILFRSACAIKRRFSGEKNARNPELSAAYKPGDAANFDLDDNYFTSKNKADGKPFTLLLPPPNITGTLHLGHALTASVQDGLVKWYKMQGVDTLWIPGLDHAGIATQVVVEKKLWKEKGITRWDLGREHFEKEIWKWMSEKSATIVKQLKLLNVSLNWEKEMFTMDKASSAVVVEAFTMLFEEGLIYRGDNLVNWSCALQSAISDIEVDHVSVSGPTPISLPGYSTPIKFGELNNFAYKLKDSEDEIVVSTTRPETMLGDVAVAVNPTDSRFARFIGKLLHHPFRNDYIPVIADDFVDPNFGTGAVKITPAHDPNDFEVGKRHNLTTLRVINEQGLLTETCGEFSGLRRFTAREVILTELNERKLCRGRQNHNMTVPICSRSKDVVEFLLKPQWFLNCSAMAERAVHAVRAGDLKIEPPNFEKVWFQWLDNIRDWCISRQLWWGHRIPAYLCHIKESKTKSVWVAAQNSTEARIKASKMLRCAEQDLECKQDEDVLDTWFSSGLQPLSASGWPQNSSWDKQYPISLMETGHDILFFWVARMVMLGSHLSGKLPFNQILLHGLICDAHGRKMSKSLGNVISPEDVIQGASLDELKNMLVQSHTSGILTKDELNVAAKGQRKLFPQGIPECGTDALRFTLLSHNIKSHVINFDVNECHTNRLFCNKMWQATKFTVMWCRKASEFHDQASFYDNSECSITDRWILSRLSHMVESVNTALEWYEFHKATAALKDFFYYEFCDIYLESIKTDFKERLNHPVSREHCKTLVTCLDHGFRALAPFMPALAQHLHRHLPVLSQNELDKSFPKNVDFRDKPLEIEFNLAMNIVTAIRRLKKVFNVLYKHQPKVYLLNDDFAFIHKYSDFIQDLCSLHTLNVIRRKEDIEERRNVVEDRVDSTVIFLIVPEDLMQNFKSDSEKMQQKKEKLLKDLSKIENMRVNVGYEENATPEEKEASSKKLAVLQEKIARIEYIQTLSKALSSK